ncbi:MAG: tetratricopeptide repeat protein [Rikenellaceae bacterium]|nr:tetratricopeptide repeat protein [Rikenellaceae bacterium]
MATKKVKTQQEAAAAPEEAIQNALSSTERFFEQNGKKVISACVVVILVIGGYFAYKYLYNAPRTEKASQMVFVAEQLFAVDSFATALNGDGNNAGFLEVAEKYGATAPGNLARHYAGICYLKLGELDNALSMLESYKQTDGVPNAIVNAQNIGLQGDIHVQKENYEKAAALYKKAVAASDNSLTAPMYLKKLGLVYEKLGNRAAALEAYKRISTEYLNSMEAQDIQKYIGQTEQE